MGRFERLHGSLPLPCVLYVDCYNSSLLRLLRSFVVYDWLDLYLYGIACVCSYVDFTLQFQIYVVTGSLFVVDVIALRFVVLLACLLHLMVGSLLVR